MEYTYEACTLRYRPDTVSGEFINVGVLMVSHHIRRHEPKFFFEFTNKTTRVHDFFRNIYDRHDFGWMRRTFKEESEKLFTELYNRPGIGFENFDILRTQLHKTVLGSFFWGEITSGITADSKIQFTNLMNEWVYKNYSAKENNSVSDEEFWKGQLLSVEQAASSNNLELQFGRMLGPEKIHAYFRQQNTFYIIEPLSLVCNPDTRKDKVDKHLGRLMRIRNERPIVSHVLLNEPESTDEVNSDEYTNRISDIIEVGDSKIIRPQELQETFSAYSRN